MWGVLGFGFGEMLSVELGPAKVVSRFTAGSTC